MIDVQSGAALARPADFAAYVKKPSERVAWTADGRLVVPSLEGGSASVFDATGRLLQTVDGQFDSASGSADGAAVVLFALDPPAEGGAVLRAGAASPFALPAGVEGVSVAGTHVVVRATTDTGESVLTFALP